MYCIKESLAKTTLPDKLHERQLLYTELLPNWEKRIYTLAVATFPKVDQGLMEVDDIRQEIRSAMWEAVLGYDPDRGMTVGSWIYRIINQASGLIARLQYLKMPHDAVEGHGMQTLPLESNTENPESRGSHYEHGTADPDAIDRVEIGLLTAECVEVIRPVMNVGFEQDAFDMLIGGMNIAETAKALHSNPARVSSIRLKMKIAYALLYEMSLEEVSAAKNVAPLATRVKRLLAERKSERDKERENPPKLCPQFI